MLIYSAPSTATSIPVIDLAESFSDDPEARGRVAWEIHKASRDTGFFYVTNHYVPQEIMDGQLAIARDFFDLTLDEKMTADARRSPCLRGYEAMAIQALDEGSQPDLKEGFQVGRDLADDHPYVARGFANHGANQWPEVMPALRGVTENYIEHMRSLGTHLVRLLALSLEQPQDYFDAALDEVVVTTRMLHYPPQQSVGAGNQLGAGAHTDWGLITLLLQDEVGGLEVQNADGEWIRAPHIPGTFVVNLGDMVPVLTNGLYHSTMHRVLNCSSARDRYSVPTFFDLDYEYVIEPVPSCVADGVPTREPVTVGQHIAEMFRRTYTNVSSEIS
ncbi:isopenicillin N synthase family dioxygenase [Gordonia sp. NPDC003376]